MATKPPTSPYGRTAFDLIAELLKRGPVVATLLLILTLLVVAFGYGVKEGYFEFHSRPQKEKTNELAQPTLAAQGSPFLHWYESSTTLDLNQCKSVIAQTYTSAGAGLLETPDSSVDTWAQVSVDGSVTAVIMCILYPKGAVLQVFASGPESSAAKNRAGTLFRTAQGLLPQQGTSRK